LIPAGFPALFVATALFAWTVFRAAARRTIVTLFATLVPVAGTVALVAFPPAVRSVLSRTCLSVHARCGRRAGFARLDCCGMLRSAAGRATPMTAIPAPMLGAALSAFVTFAMMPPRPPDLFELYFALSGRSSIGRRSGIDRRRTGRLKCGQFLWRLCCSFRRRLHVIG
jgi:hypothetical protein